MKKFFWIRATLFIHLFSVWCILLSGCQIQPRFFVIEKPYLSNLTDQSLAKQLESVYQTRANHPIFENTTKEAYVQDLRSTLEENKFWKGKTESLASLRAAHRELDEMEPTKRSQILNVRHTRQKEQEELEEQNRKATLKSEEAERLKKHAGFKGKGKWMTKLSTSPIDDSQTVKLVLVSSDTYVDGYGKQIRPTLVVKCQENRTSVYINYKNFISTKSTTVTVRFDKEKATTQSWGVSSDHQAVFAPNGVSLAKSLMMHERLVVRLIPYSEDPVTTSFDLLGLYQAIVPLRKSCHW